MHYTIKGLVIRGDGYGRKIGFPTVNLETNTDTEALPPEGVYAGEAELGGKVYRAGIVLGPNNKTEAHLIGYDGDAYGKKAILTINKFIRGYKEFKTEQELIEQIEKDLQMC